MYEKSMQYIVKIKNNDKAMFGENSPSYCQDLVLEFKVLN